MTIDKSKVIESIKAQTEEFKKQCESEFSEITKQSDKLKLVCEIIKESWTGSCIGYHSKLFYGDFEKPPHAESFNIEWGGINGFSNKWCEKTVEEVKSRIEKMTGNRFDMDDFEKKVKEIGVQTDDFQKDIEMQVNSIVDSKQDNPFKLFEKYIPERKLKNYIASYSNRQWMSRDTKAFSQGIIIPSVIYYEALSYEVEALIKAGNGLIKVTNLFIKWFEINGGSKIPMTLNEKKNDLSLLHHEIFSSCQSLYSTTQYAEAVEKSFKVVRDRLRELTGHETGSEAFGKGKLHVKGAAAQNVDSDFNEGAKFLMMAIDMFRNEKSHTSKAKIDDEQKAHEYLSLSSLAMHLLDLAEIKNLEIAKKD